MICTVQNYNIGWEVFKTFFAKASPSRCWPPLAVLDFKELMIVFHTGISYQKQPSAWGGTLSLGCEPLLAFLLLESQLFLILCLTLLRTLVWQRNIFACLGQAVFCCFA